MWQLCGESSRSSVGLSRLLQKPLTFRQQLHKEECHTPPPARKSLGEKHKLLQERAERAEALLVAAGISAPVAGTESYSHKPISGDEFRVGSSAAGDRAGGSVQPGTRLAPATNLEIESSNFASSLQTARRRMPTADGQVDLCLINDQQPVPTFRRLVQTKSPLAAGAPPTQICPELDVYSGGNTGERSQSSEMMANTSPVNTVHFARYISVGKVFADEQPG